MDGKSKIRKYTRKKVDVFDINVLKDSRICNFLNVRANYKTWREDKNSQL